MSSSDLTKISTPWLYHHLAINANSIMAAANPNRKRALQATRARLVAEIIKRQ